MIEQVTKLLYVIYILHGLLDSLDFCCWKVTRLDEITVLLRKPACHLAVQSSYLVSLFRLSSMSVVTSPMVKSSLMKYLAPLLVNMSGTICSFGWH